MREYSDAVSRLFFGDFTEEFWANFNSKFFLPNFYLYLPKQLLGQLLTNNN